MLALDPKSYPDTESKEFQTYGNDSLRILYNYYGRDASNEFRGHFTKSDRLLKCPYNASQLESGGFKTYVNKQKIKIKEENSKRYSFTNSKLELKKGDKYRTKKSIDMLERELEHLNTKIENPVLVEDLLQDIAVESALPNVQRLLIIYLLVPHTEAVVEHSFSKMGQIMTKKRCLLDDNSLDLLMRISHNKESLTTKDKTQVMDIWSRLSERRIFSDKL